MSPDQYCANRALASGSSFYYTFRFLPPERRRAITALYAFCREVDDAVDEIRDAQVARLKLSFWRGEISALFSGSGSHPVTQALAPFCEPLNWSATEFNEIIDGMQMDLDKTRYLNRSELEVYCHRVAGIVGVMSAKVFGYSDPQTLRYAEHLGHALQLTNIIRDVGDDARLGRLYLPQDELRSAGVQTSEILRGQSTPAFFDLMRQQAKIAHARYGQALALLPKIDRQSQRPGLMMAAIYRTLLRRIEARNFPVFAERVRLAPITKLLLALRVWVRP